MRLAILLLCGLSGFAQTAPIFDDVPSSKPYYSHVNLLKLRFITTGCSYVPSLYCPEDAPYGQLTRGQAATLIIRSIYSATTGNPEGYTYSGAGPYFWDVPTNHPQYPYIQLMKELGVTQGCGNNGFCPDAPVTYGELATFAIRARGVRDTGTVILMTPEDCNLPVGDFRHFQCTPYFGDLGSSHFSFPYVQKAYELIGGQMVGPNCGGWGQFLSGHIH